VSTEEQLKSDSQLASLDASGNPGRKLSGEPTPGFVWPHRVAFWLVALAFLLNMAFSAVPTPLYVLYQQRDHFSGIMVTIVYAVYAVGVIASLFLVGHVSDWVGRRKMLVLALLVNVASSLLFIFFPSLIGLIVARVVCGVAVGMTTATATAYLAELHSSARPGTSTKRPQVIAIAANLGGIGFGPLLGGLMAQYAPSPLRLSYVVVGAALVVLALSITLAPETVAILDEPPTWRPQRVAVPLEGRRHFYAATFAGLAAFAVYGVFNSLVPSFLAGTLHETSPAVAGAVAFSAFAAGALAQIALGRLDTTRMLRWSVPILLAGLALFTVGMWVPSLLIFILGGVVTGAGAGLVFRGALVAAGTTAPLQARAEVMAGFFLGAYVGLSVPVIGLGIATMHVDAKEAMLVFVVLVAIAIVWSVRGVVRFTSGALEVL
jgi:MFS family permease